MKIKEILLLVLIVAAGILFTHVQQGKLDWDWEWDWEWEDGGPFFAGTHEYTTELTQDIDPPLPQELEVVNSHGFVEVEGTADGKISVLFQKKVWRRNEEEARAVADQIQMTVERMGSKLILSTNRESFRKKRFSTNFRITVPEGLAVQVRNSYGLVKTLKTGITSIDNSHGRVMVSDIRGTLTAANSYEDMEIADAVAECRLENHYGLVSLARIKGTVKLIHSYGDVRLEGADQDVTIEGSHSEIALQKVAGPTWVETSYRDVTLFDVGRVTVKGSHSSVRVEKAGGTVDIDSNYGRVELQDMQGPINIRGTSLEVSGRGLSSQDIQVTTTYDDVDLAGFSGKATLSVSHGDIRLEPSGITADLRAEGEYSGIRLFWPAGIQTPFEARVRNGDVRWGLGQTPDLSQKNGESVLKAFGQEPGKPKVLLTTSYGDIIVEAQGLVEGEAVKL